MLRTILDYYTHEFKQEEGIVAAFFHTKTGTGYRVYFYPGKDYFENLEESSLIYSHGYFFGFTKVGEDEDKKEPLDIRVMNTIMNIVNEFYDSEGADSILIFHCSEHWGPHMKRKRANHFGLWFDYYTDGKHKFNKYNEEIVVNEFTGQDGEILVDKEYLSLIIESSNPLFETILDEFQSIKDSFSAGKNQY